MRHSLLQPEEVVLTGARTGCLVFGFEEGHALARRVAEARERGEVQSVQVRFIFRLDAHLGLRDSKIQPVREDDNKRTPASRRCQRAQRALTHAQDVPPGLVAEERRRRRHRHHKPVLRLQSSQGFQGLSRDQDRAAHDARREAREIIEGVSCGGRRSAHSRERAAVASQSAVVGRASPPRARVVVLRSSKLRRAGVAHPCRSRRSSAGCRGT